MPFKRNKYKSRRSRGLTKSQKFQVKRMVKAEQETKFALKTYHNDEIDNVSERAFVLRNVAQGVTGVQRVGAKIKTTRIRIQLNFKCTTGGVANPEANRIRFAIYEPYDVGTIFDPALIDIGSRINPYDFRVLYDRMFVLNTVGGPGGHSIYITIPYKRTIVYDGPDGADISKHDLQIFTMSDSQAAAHPTVAGFVEVSYKDG